jgi:hypothetical protein
MFKVRPLREVLSEIPDPRAARGTRHEFDAVLMLICVAMLSGCGNPNQIAEWGASQDREYLRMLGFKRGQSIRKSALYELVARIDLEAVEHCLMMWSESIVAELREGGALAKDVGGEAEAESRSPTQLEAVAIDGKTLRGSKKQGAEFSHLLSAVMHDTGITLTQVVVPGKTNEIPVTQVLLQRLLLEGRVLTSDAMLTQKAIAAANVEKRGTTS